MKSVILIVLGSFFFYSNAVGQGAWNLKYLSLDSLNESFIGKELRIDFKSKVKHKSKQTDRNIRKIFSKRDTVTLNLSNQAIRFVENWKIYADHGVVSDQTLQSVGGSDSEQLVIKEMFVRAVLKSSITVEVYTYRPGSKELLSVQEINVDKSLIAGVIVEQ
jgi:hypothetical protein